MVAPFVQVSINNQTIYSEPSPRTIPLFVVSTRANKTTPDGSGIAPGTQESGVLRLVSSQRELIQNYGNPVFVTSEGDPVPGDETNEYQLLACTGGGYCRILDWTLKNFPCCDVAAEKPCDEKQYLTN